MSESCSSVEQNVGKIERFQYLQDKNYFARLFKLRFHQALWENKEHSGRGIRNSTFLRGAYRGVLGTPYPIISG